MRKNGRLWVSMITLGVLVGAVAFGVAAMRAGSAASPTIPPVVSPNPAGLCRTTPTAAPSGPVRGGCLAPTPIIATGNSPGADAGVPAITPQVSGGNAGTPAFDAKAVEAYIATHPPGGRIDTSGPVIVESVQFITAQQADALLQSQSGLLPTRLVCLVKLSGTFTLIGPPGTKPGTFQTLYQVYDARTGNFIFQQSG